MGFFGIGSSKPKQADTAKADRFNNLFATVPVDGEGSMSESYSGVGSHPLDTVKKDIRDMPDQTSINEELMHLDAHHGVDAARSKKVERVEEEPAFPARAPRDVPESEKAQTFNTLFGTVSADPRDGHRTGMTSDGVLDKVADDISGMRGPEDLNRDLIAMDKKEVMDSKASTGVKVAKDNSAAIGKQMESEIRKENFDRLFGTVSVDNRDGHRTGMTSDGVLDKVADDMSAMPDSYNEQLVKNENAEAKPSYGASDYPTYPERAAEYAKRQAKAEADGKVEKFNELFGTVSVDNRDGHRTGMTSDGVLDKVADDMSAMPDSYNEQLVKNENAEAKPSYGASDYPTYPERAAEYAKRQAKESGKTEAFNSLFGTVSADTRDGHRGGMTSDGVLDKVADDMSKMPAKFNEDLVKMDKKQVMDAKASTGVTVSKGEGKDVESEVRHQKFNSLFGDVSADAQNSGIV